MHVRRVTPVGPHLPVQSGTATESECVDLKLTVIIKERNDSELQKRRIRIKPSILSLYEFLSHRSHCHIVMQSRIRLFSDAKLVVDLNESSDGLNDKKGAQLEADHAAARARKQEQKGTASPLSSETLRPLLKKVVKGSIEDAKTNAYRIYAVA